jgi:hypothetical protein
MEMKKIGFLYCLIESSEPHAPLLFPSWEWNWEQTHPYL